MDTLYHTLDRTNNKLAEMNSIILRDMDKETGTAGFKYSWRKMEAAAQDRAGWRQVVCGVCSMLQWCNG